MFKETVRVSGFALLGFFLESSHLRSLSVSRFFVES